MVATRQLGRSGLSLPPVMIGGNVFGWTADAQASFQVLDHFLAHGLNAIDTADMYSTWIPGHTGGESETIIGQWLAQRGGRDKIVLATKVGAEMPDGRGLRPAWIEAEVDASLKRLQTDYIDLYQAHFDDPQTPLTDTLGAFARLIEKGKVRAIGASNYSIARLREALATSQQHNLPRYESLQPQYNLMERQIEVDLLPFCREQHIGVIPYYALAAGFLTGKYRKAADLEQSARGAGSQKYLTPQGEQTIAALDSIATRLGVSIAQVAIAWLIDQPGVTAPIASARTVEQATSLIQACSITLDQDASATLRGLNIPTGSNA